MFSFWVCPNNYRFNFEYNILKNEVYIKKKTNNNYHTIIKLTQKKKLLNLSTNKHITYKEIFDKNKLLINILSKSKYGD